MRTVTGVDVVTRGSSHVIVTLTDEGGRKQTFELTRLLAEHLSMAALCQEAAGGRRAPHPRGDRRSVWPRQGGQGVRVSVSSTASSPSAGSKVARKHALEFRH